MDAISESRLKGVFPSLADKIRQMEHMLKFENPPIYIRVVQGYRTVEEQDALYAIGRTTAGKVVTNCRGGHSYHNFGLAVDVVPSQFAPEQPYSPDWNSSHPAWKKMQEAGQAVGLTSGATWRTFPDAPHFQLTGDFPGNAPDDYVRDLAQGPRGLQAVWDEVRRSIYPTTPTDALTV